MIKIDDQSLHRLVKVALDNGTAQTLDEAVAMFKGYTLDVDVDTEAAQIRCHQIALLTIVALARRVFLGGVRVYGELDIALAPDLPIDGTLKDAVQRLGGSLSDVKGGKNPLITIADGAVEHRRDFHIRPVFLGWRGGIVPAETVCASEPEAMPLAAMLAAALAVNEAFAFVADQDSASGWRSAGLSLWDLEKDWSSTDGAPALEILPSKLWMIGLGHLGQAYLWALGLLPYPREGLELVLQDTDIVTASTESTSVLTDSSMLGRMKARLMASWAEQRGFRSRIYERRFDASFRLQSDEPTVAICGVDNADGRRALDDAGFALAIEAGLGQGHRDFRTMRLHTLPATRPASEIWKGRGNPEDVTSQPAYQQLLANGLDQCGVTTLAGKAVGAPFVGSVAAAIAISELLRLLHGGRIDALVDLDLHSVEHRAVVAQRRDFGSLNPGFVPVRSN